MLPLPSCWRQGAETSTIPASSPVSAATVVPLSSVNALRLPLPQHGQQPASVMTPAPLAPCLQPTLQAAGSPAHFVQGGAVGSTNMGGLKLPVRRRNVTFSTEPPVEVSADISQVVPTEAFGAGMPTSPSAASTRSLDIERAGSTRHGQAYLSSKGLTPTASPSPGPYVALYMGTPRTPGLSPHHGEGSSVASSGQRHVCLNVRETPSGSTPKFVGSPASSYDFWRYMAYGYASSPVQGVGAGLVAPQPAAQLQPAPQPPSPSNCRVDAAAVALGPAAALPEASLRRPMRRCV